jgi:hypothetical protein
LPADTPTTSPDPLAGILGLLRDMRDGLAAKSAEVQPALLTHEQAATYLGMSRSAWFRALAAGQVPAPVDVPGGTGPRVRLRDLEEFVKMLKVRRRKPRTEVTD